MAQGEIKAGNSDKLGATYDGNGVNFAIFSQNATKIELCLFDDKGAETKIELPEKDENGVWHGYVEGLKPGQKYGYRVHGPYDPANGHLFNPSKLLMDPYARELDGEIDWERDELLIEDKRDSAPFVPRSVVIDNKRMNSIKTKNLHTPWDKTIVYETHAKGFSALNPAVPEENRGKFAGLGDKASVNYLKSLGITAVELLPVQQFNSGRHLKKEKGLKNYWGYDPVNYFSPNTDYGSPAEFKKMVKELHNAGIEVIMDVVYNHTGEGGPKEQALSFKGIDNASYYRLNPKDKSKYLDTSGCGNSLDVTHPMVLKMTVDSLRYWVEEMGVDGFRFDLASTVARNENNEYSQNSPFLEAVKNDPILNKVKLIAEPWDLGYGGYQVGNFPQPWREWNDKFRDDTRLFWCGRHGLAAAMARRLTASDDIKHHNSNTSPTINFITAHDGFTLNDLVSYERKHNESNGENNRDGSDDNKGWNTGAEGKTDDPEIIAHREKRQRNMLATLMLSRGVPMILGGDEFARTQNGNNNPYCQDNEISWFNWEKIDENGKNQTEFVQKLTELRREHPVLGSDQYLNGQVVKGDTDNDIRWFRPDGQEMQSNDWNRDYARTLSYVLNGKAAKDNPGAHEKDVDNDFFVVMNAHNEDIEWTLPRAPHGGKWEVVFNTAKLGEEKTAQAMPKGTKYNVSADSVVLFTCKPQEKEKELTKAQILAAKKRHR
ncbi:MAG: glycogen debranching protein GlgX [Alphaproteobacteria bacterium]